MSSTTTDVDLTRGNVAPALAKKAGPELDKACAAIRPLPIGSVAATDGFDLLCQKIIHCNVPHFESEGSTKPVRIILVPVDEVDVHVALEPTVSDKDNAALGDNSANKYLHNANLIDIKACQMLKKVYFAKC